jgi:hypothetical protein
LRPPKATGKSFLFKRNSDDRWEVDNQLLKDRCDERILLALKGEGIESIWVDNLKDERVSLEKVALGKTRLFTMAPVDLTIVVRMVFQSFVSAMTANHNGSFSAVGINPYGPEWTQLYNYLREMGPSGIDFDYKEYDGRLDADCMMNTCEAINKWYRARMSGLQEIRLFNGQVLLVTVEDLERIRRVLFTEFLHTEHVSFDCLYITCIGNPSGNPLTVVINTMVGRQYIVMAYYELRDTHVPQNKWIIWKDEPIRMTAREAIRPVCYGDDNLTAMHPMVSSWFHFENIRYFFEQYDIVITDAAKTGEVENLKPIEELRFLKNGFRPHPKYPSIKLASLDKKSIAELTNWVRQSDDPWEATRVNCENAVKFAYYHERDYYDFLYSSICAAFEKQGKEPLCFTWRMWDTEFLRSVHGGS